MFHDEVRYDKFRAGDYVDLIPNAPEFIQEKLDAKNRKVVKVEKVPARQRRAVKHCQFVYLADGQKYSGYWFKPIERPKQVPAPKGAITSIDQLFKVAGKPLWRISRKHFDSVDLNNPRYFNGKIGIEFKYKGTPEEYRYHWVTFENETGSGTWERMSLIDHNLIRNTYNDWFLFHRKEDAEAYFNS